MTGFITERWHKVIDSGLVKVLSFLCTSPNPAQVILLNFDVSKHMIQFVLHLQIRINK